jgi:diguanylate cyclase (GGDEF)-like protein
MEELLAENAALKEQKQQLERDLAHVLKHDQLTGLLNRAAFINQVDNLLQKLNPAESPSAMIEIGISGLPRISGSLGRHASDYMIASLAARINQGQYAEFICGRLDYSNFALFIPDVGDPVIALTTAKRMLEALKAPIDWIDRKISLDTSAGVALSSETDNDGLTLIQNAGLALRNRAERMGPNYGFFNPSLAQAARRRTEVVSAIEDAAANGYFKLQHQPFFATSSGELAGFESLLRLEHPKFGSISPIEFIPVAEERGLIAKVGTWALNEACMTATQWPSHLIVSVNISPEQFYTGSLLTDVHTALEISSLPAYRLELEVTESTMLKDSDIVLAQLSSLREMGCAIVLDDFGTGYSSLSYLWKYPFSKLKIDRSFIQALDSTKTIKGILKSIADLARNLGLKITAEGVETIEHADIVRGLGCDYVQGYLCGKPTDTKDLAAIIMKNFSEKIRPQPAEALRSIKPAARN